MSLRIIWNNRFKEAAEWEFNLWALNTYIKIYARLKHI